MINILKLSRETWLPARTRFRPLAVITGAVIALSVGACETTGVSDEAELTTSLAPMEKPVFSVGDTIYWLQDGSQDVTMKIVAVNADTINGNDSDGCQWTTLAWGFAPGTKWSGCSPFTDGTQKISGVDGAIWPLEVGKSISYTFSGTNKNGDSWDGTRRCKVEAAVRITTVSGEHDTYKVTCKDKWTDRVWYVSPELEATVYFERFRKQRNERMKRELIKVEQAGSTS